MSNTAEHRSIDVSAGSVAAWLSGPVDADPVVLLHGWPQDHSCWDRVVALAGRTHRCVALDLPGIGGSRLDAPRAGKSFLAELVHEVITALDLRDVTLVGHDIGGMVTYAYLRRHPELRAAALIDTIVPGISPWDSITANPRLWHFGFHAVPRLPEALVGSNIEAYFDHFYDAVAARPAALSPKARGRYVDSYRRPSALRQGFDFYRAFPADAAENRADTAPVDTPVLYVRGVGGTLPANAYADGLRAAGTRRVTTKTVEGAGHYLPEEQPEELWLTIEKWLG